MRNSLHTIFTILMALNSLGAADLLRPTMELTHSAAGIQVNLNFEHVSEAQWRTMLEEPESFHNYGYGVAGGPGEAALPMLTVFVPITQHFTPVISNIIRHDYDLAALSLKATPEGHLDSDRQTAEIATYDWNRVSRSQMVDILAGELMNIKGQVYLPITIHPVALAESTQSLEIPTLIQFEIQGVDLADASLVTDDGGFLSVTLPEEQFASRGHYLIITPPQFELYIQYFADWKTRMGYKVTIVGTDIAGNSASTIKGYIQTAWDTWETRPDFLVIVGDEDQGIPGHYIQNPQGENLVTDHPYALLEGDDSFPEIMVGRLSVDTISELVSFTSKIVAYESSPNMDESEWFERALMISTTWGAASAQATKEWVADKLIEKGFDQVYTAYHPENGTATNISFAINEGVGFVNYRGYGMYNGWYGPDFTSTDIYNLIHNGSKTPVITSVVCGGGNFAAPVDDPCFGEVWTRIGTFAVPKGAVAFFGPSELYTHTQFNNVIDVGIYSAIFDKGVTTLGEALWNGKFELWRNYHQNTYFPFDQTPEFYHHVYNLLGDPGMQLWTEVPRTLTVNHLQTLSTAENSASITVLDEDGDPISDAYVSFYNAENAVGGYTNTDGSISLPFQAAAAGELELTVTGKNLLPYLATIPITESSLPLTLNNWTTSVDGQLIAGEASLMYLSLNNAGNELTNVLITFLSESDGIILSEAINIPTIPAQSIYDVTPVEISPSSQLSHGAQVIIKVEVIADGQSMNWSKYLTIQAPLVNISGLNLVGGLLDAGDSALVELELTNTGGVASGPITLSPIEHELVTFGSDVFDCPAIDIDASASTDGLLSLIFSDQVFPGERLTLQFECLLANGIDTLEYVVEVGIANRYGPSQPDDYGYRMFDNFDLSFTESPEYEWIEIDPNLGGFGSRLNINDEWEEQDESQTISLPFPVSYYGQTYTTITVCSNGWAAFGNHSVVNFHNRTIPSPIGPTAMLAPFWDDLITFPGAVYQGVVASGDAFIVEWSRMGNLGLYNEMSFQIIIFDADASPTLTGDSEIKFQYKNYENLDGEANFSTVGIESPDSQTGIQASYNNYGDKSLGSIRDGTALLFTTDRGERLPAGIIALNRTELSFVQNPWSTGRDSIVFTNIGETPLAYNIDINSTLDRLPPAPRSLNRNTSKSSPNEIFPTSSIREGTDAYGYVWKKDSDDYGPIYYWVDIETPENLVVQLGDLDDRMVGPRQIGFEFPYYDQIYSSIYISSNGCLSFMFIGNLAPWENIELPSSSAPSTLLAPWWDDLNNESGPQGKLYLWTNGENECIVTWKDFPKWGTSDLYTFQVILDAYGGILFQYARMDGVTNSSTVGMQSAGRNAGFTIHHNENTPFPAGTAISINPPVPWFAASGWSGLINPDENKSFVVDVQTMHLDQGHYEIPLTLSTSSGNIPEASLNISLDLVYGQPPLGDVNQDYQVNVHDLIKMLDFILLIDDMNEDQLDLADLSGDETVNISDTILLIELILARE